MYQKTSGNWISNGVGDPLAGSAFPHKVISNVKVAQAPTFSVAISGEKSIQYAEKDAKLTANIQGATTPAANPTYYQWYQVGTDSTRTKIENATSETYTIP